MWNKCFWKKLLKTGLIVVAMETTFTDRVASFAKVVGCSMQPSLNPDYHKGTKDWILQNRLVVADYDVNRGDIVTFKMPYDHTVTAIKRIVAVEGDLVRKRTSLDKVVLIPQGHVWVEGDNGRLSRDSNSFGPLPVSLVTSKVTHVIWPPSRCQELNTEELDCDRVIKGTGPLMLGDDA